MWFGARGGGGGCFWGVVGGIGLRAPCQHPQDPPNQRLPSWFEPPSTLADMPKPCPHHAVLGPCDSDSGGRGRRCCSGHALMLLPVPCAAAAGLRWGCSSSAACVRWWRRSSRTAASLTGSCEAAAGPSPWQGMPASGGAGRRRPPPRLVLPRAGTAAGQLRAPAAAARPGLYYYSCFSCTSAIAAHDKPTPTRPFATPQRHVALQKCGGRMQHPGVDAAHHRHLAQQGECLHAVCHLLPLMLPHPVPPGTWDFAPLGGATGWTRMPLPVRFGASPERLNIRVGCSVSRSQDPGRVRPHAARPPGSRAVWRLGGPGRCRRRQAAAGCY